MQIFVVHQVMTPPLFRCSEAPLRVDICMHTYAVHNVWLVPCLHSSSLSLCYCFCIPGESYNLPQKDLPRCFNKTLTHHRAAWRMALAQDFEPGPLLHGSSTSSSPMQFCVSSFFNIFSTSPIPFVQSSCNKPNREREMMSNFTHIAHPSAQPLAVSTTVAALPVCADWSCGCG